ncbi:MAG TPA: V-type ATPase subunit [Mobilitalea sp.]|nr:V-type ATPase subunit [Mobilitalea sp.]
MNSMLSYSGINTKIKAMSANLISREEFQKIAAFDTTADFFAFLKNHPGYRDVFMRYDEHQLHRADAEKVFINSFYLDYIKIYRFANQEQRKDLKLVFLRHEVTILKHCIHQLYNEKDNYDLGMFQEFFDKHSKINVTALASSRSMEEYIRLLTDTEYYPMFMKISNTGNASSFDYEMQLDVYYFKKMWKIRGKLVAGDTLKAVTSRLGNEIDMLNIMWIYRAKTRYDLSSTEILSYVIPINYKLTKELLAKLIKATTTDEFINILKSSYYKGIYTSLLDGTIERTYHDTLTKIYKLNKSKYPVSMNEVNYYLYQKETEITRLTTALECIRYGLEPIDKLKYIVTVQ